MSGWLTTALEACASERVKKIARQIPRGLCTANERVILVLGYVSITGLDFTSHSRPMFTTHSRLMLTRRGRPMFTTHSRPVFTTVAQSLLSKKSKESLKYGAQTREYNTGNNLSNKSR